jgi:putative flippase GtrA
LLTEGNFFMLRFNRFHPMLMQLTRFGVVGFSASIVNFVIVIFLVELFHMYPLLANLFAFFTAFIVSYIGHRYWTFAHKDHRFIKCMPKFFITALLSLTVSEGLYYFMLRYKVSYEIGLLLVIVIVAFLSFTLSKFWAFRVSQNNG